MIQSSPDQSSAEASRKPAAATMFEGSSSLKRRRALFAVVAVILSIYSYPALRTAFTTKSTRLPAVSAPDLGLYLSISQLKEKQSGTVLNPYYHISVPASAVGYLRFRSGPRLFGVVTHLFTGHLWWALFFWNLAWWLLLCLATIRLFENFLPQPSLELVLAGVSLLMLFSVEGFGRTIASWIHLSQPGFGGGLLYLRPFTPQVMMPLFVCYVALQIRALREKSMVTWGLMALLQFLAFTTFPFATLMMAGITAVAGLWYIVARPQESPWQVLLGFMLVCAIADATFARHGSGGVGLGFPEPGSLIKFQPALAVRAMGKMWVLTATLVAATAATRRLRPEVKWTLLGLGLSNLFFVMGDAVASEPVFFLSDHIGYFYQPTIIILFMFLVSAHIADGVRARRMIKAIALATVAWCFIYGSLMAETNYKTNLFYNVVQADLADWFAKGKVSGNDLVVTQFDDSSYDACEWIPLLSEAEVLYCRNAQLALTGEQNRQVQRLREVLYLYFHGKDRHWFETTTHFDRYGLYGDLITFHKPNELAERLLTLRHEMIPYYDRIDHGDPDMHDVFRRFRRVWIIQERQDPAFVNARLNSYLELNQQEVAGSLLVASGEPK